MELAELELQLKVWKDLAINNQVLMLNAKEELGLDKDCSAEELRAALNDTIAKGKSAAADIKAIEDKTASQISSMEAKVASANSSKDEAIEAKLQAEEAVKESARKLAVGLESSANEVTKAKAQMNDSLKEMKRIQKLLADTPENVVKKLKQLKKEKLDETNLRKTAEQLNRQLRKDLQKAKESDVLLEKAADLAAGYRNLKELADEQYKKLAGLVEDKSSLDSVPNLEDKALEALEELAPKESKDKAA